MTVAHAIRRALFCLCLFAAFVGIGGCGSGNPNTATIYPVGRTAFDWTDPARPEKYGPAPGSARKIAVTIWYPASPGAKAMAGPIITDGQATVL